MLAYRFGTRCQKKETSLSVGRIIYWDRLGVNAKWMGAGKIGDQKEVEIAWQPKAPDGPITQNNPLLDINLHNAGGFSSSPSARLLASHQSTD